MLHDYQRWIDVGLRDCVVNVEMTKDKRNSFSALDYQTAVLLDL